ncbi:MAG: protein kinase [Myxococcales bacterium]|nr:protein kinase [Myxococcales bacterium]
MSACLRCASPLASEAQFCPHCGTSVRALSEAGTADGKLIDGRYAIRSRIGAGGSGTVYLADHIHLGKKVAIKAMHKDLLTDALALERFRREATMVGELTNPHIVQVFDYGRLPDGRVYLAMEYLEGESLQAMLARLGRVSVDQTIDVLLQACEALGEAHSLGYVHRDLRPKNLFLSRRATESNFLKVLDFGLAKAVDLTQTAAHTTLGLTFGDPRYMSPEQAKGLAVDQRSDLYQLGCVAYEMLTGAPPFHGAGVFEVLAKHATEAPSPLVVHRPDVPPALETIIMRLLAKAQADRFATASQLAEALRASLPAASARLAASRVASTSADAPPAHVPAAMAKPSAAPSPKPLGTSQAWYNAGDVLATDGGLSERISLDEVAASFSLNLADGRRRQKLILLVSLLASAAIAAGIVLWFVGRSSPAARKSARPDVAMQSPPISVAPSVVMDAAPADSVMVSPPASPPESLTAPSEPTAKGQAKPSATTAESKPVAPDNSPDAPTTPATPSTPLTLDIPSELARAQVELATGDLDTAEQRLGQVIAAAPRSAPAHVLLGETHLARGAFALAAEAFKAALRIDPENARARRGYATAESKLNQRLTKSPKSLKSRRRPRHRCRLPMRHLLHRCRPRTHRRRLLYRPAPQRRKCARLFPFTVATRWRRRCLAIFRWRRPTRRRRAMAGAKANRAV